MKKKDIVHFAGSVLVTVIGTVIGLALMVKSGKKIDEDQE